MAMEWYHLEHISKVLALISKYNTKNMLESSLQLQQKPSGRYKISSRLIVESWSNHYKNRISESFTPSYSISKICSQIRITRHIYFLCNHNMDFAYPILKWQACSRIKHIRPSRSCWWLGLKRCLIFEIMIKKRYQSLGNQKNRFFAEKSRKMRSI